MRVLRSRATTPGRRRTAASSPFDVPSGDGFLGVRHESGTLFTTLTVGPGPARPHRVDRPWPDLGPGAVLPLALVAQWMRHPDAAATELTVSCRGSGCVGDGPAAAAYRGLTGPLSIAADRGVQLRLRFAPLAHPELVARHGSGSAAPLRACVSATRRLAVLLRSGGLAVTALTAAELTAAAPSTDPIAGDPPDTGHDDPDALIGALTAQCAGTPRTATLLWRPGRPEPRLSLDPDGPALPAATVAALTAAALPCGGSGPIVGADHAGHPIGLRLAGPAIAEATITGELDLARRIVARLAATGVSAAVFTDRPERWAGLIDAVGDPALLHAASSGTARVLVDDRPDRRLGPLDGHTVLRVAGPGTVVDAPPESPALRQDPSDPRRAVAVGGGRSIPVRLVGTPAEDALLRA